ncbi:MULTISPECIES: hypothetical protein [Rhodococcus]|uniref:Uncharacterized protein n=1 Tax=Rhodococcus oxybenzonivorans TaxID=1990687 RepID=A0AAE4V0I7_9NOCA|nr:MULTISPECIES: hypothetical protein [Rhodococcus]MDV7241843.1 hypothetical protein [Rhodococcus oxybenzonivorans]MDV7265503.1 hypothetical protein [Rhodococcus oxybenzonivorans]MDV7273623.1 hypothetical protein [Rhodococcus oxybenzonivorans]MDV7334125.1 hypothetical protein [Rhodococcus oxybenzonivorans]MDV7343544.1 hypothetical protein [Rhodococcus oxybenzonivorans]
MGAGRHISVAGDPGVLDHTCSAGQPDAQRSGSSAREIVDGTRAARTPRFVKSTTKRKSLDTDALARARPLIGLKGYVTNLSVSLMNRKAVMEKYHDL